MKGCFTLLKVILPFCGRCVKSNLGPLEYAGLWLPHEFVNRFVIWSYQHIAYASSTDGNVKSTCHVTCRMVFVGWLS